MEDKIQRAKEQLAQQKSQERHDQLTLKTEHVAFEHAFKMFWRQGRNMNHLTTRHNYWYMLVWQWIIKAVIFILAVISGSTGVINSLSPQGSSIGMMSLALMAILYILLGGYSLLTFIPMLTLTMRRYKDIGINRFLGMLVYTVMGILAIIFLLVGSAGRTICSAIFIVFALGNLLLCSLPRGQFVPKEPK